MGSDLLARLRALLRERAALPDDLADQIEAELRAEFGGREVYVRRRRKAAHLARLASAPSDAEPAALADATGLSVSQVYRYLSLIGRR